MPPTSLQHRLWADFAGQAPHVPAPKPQAPAGARHSQPTPAPPVRAPAVAPRLDPPAAARQSRQGAGWPRLGKGPTIVPVVGCSVGPSAAAPAAFQRSLKPSASTRQPLVSTTTFGKLAKRALTSASPLCTRAMNLSASARAASSLSARACTVVSAACRAWTLSLYCAASASACSSPRPLK